MQRVASSYRGDVIMFASRVPFSAFGGALFAATIFFGLAQLVSVQFDVSPPILAHDVLFTPQRIDTPVETKRKEKVERKPPVLPPGPPKGPGGDEEGAVRVPYRATPITVVVDRDGPRLRGVDGDVIPIVRPNPDYPPPALRSGTEGWVRVQFSVTSIGTVRDAVVVDSEPGTTFDDAALKAIARWRYNPRVENGEAVERVGLQTVIRFKLEN
jgi:periplasmic protein TonB